MSIKKKITSYSVIFFVLYIIFVSVVVYLDFKALNNKKSREFYENLVVTCTEIKKLMYGKEENPLVFFYKFSNIVLKILRSEGVILYDNSKYGKFNQNLHKVSLIYGDFVVIGNIKPDFLEKIFPVEPYGNVGSVINPVFVARYPLLWEGKVFGYLITWKEFNNLNFTVFGIFGTSLVFFLVYVLVISRYLSSISKDLKFLSGIIKGVAKKEFSKTDLLRENAMRSKDKDSEIYELKVAVIKMIETLKKILIETSKEKTLYERMALTDPLTGLYNRRVFTEMAEKELAKAKRYGYNFSILMIDIDNFKKINDTYGHDVGDLVLKKISEILKRNVRGADLVARFGGEEFIVMLSNTNLNGAVKKAEQLRRMIEQTPIELPNGEKLRVTVSIGVSTYRGHESLEELIKEADQALYEAKRKGKNRVEVFRESLTL
ncbi:GGDEF domain-containing protein [Aquifex aeolicus]|uniref:diguanylate cyclase n=1 Tax=Aquifex aeolicus (strain VF5) TaxID=224324 RepID=O66451_AQUAE|nr:GGDEF domain-containing protein [Aquifex aeolicus]AAC06416.1 hypothetical protein aq_035 [Aquifex aeolicus VF5]